MSRKPGRMKRQFIVLSSVAGATSDLALGLWRNRAGNRWIIPLAVFLCLTGVLLVVAVAVEALAPFVYAIF
jgi:hypothetical protein